VTMGGGRPTPAAFALSGYNKSATTSQKASLNPSDNRARTIAVRGLGTGAALGPPLWSVRRDERQENMEFSQLTNIFRPVCVKNSSSIGIIPLLRCP